MRFKSGFLVWLLPMLLLCLVAPMAGAQELVKATDITGNVQSYNNRTVTLEGTCTQWNEGAEGTVPFYTLKDYYGGVINVRTLTAPVVGEKYRVTGIVSGDPATMDVYVSETSRGPVEAPPPPPPPPPTVWEWIKAHLPLVLIVAIVVVVLVLIGLIVWLARPRKTQTAPGLATPVGAGALPGGAFPDAPPSTIEGRTIKITAPPPGTLKILPGRLEVVSGDEIVKEIRFYRVKGQTIPEVTFGRTPGAPFVHVELKMQTVSRRQAKMTFFNNQWMLTNFATSESNPTKHNGVEMPPDGQVALGEGSTIEMGEVKFVYHAS
jgi:hypothetical protein